MNAWAVVFYKAGKAPLFNVFPTQYEAYVFRRQHERHDASILPVTKVTT